MSEPGKPLRRKAFDDFVQGWGADGLDDLEARIDLLRTGFPDLSSAEERIASAMIRRRDNLRARNNEETW